MSWAPAAGSRQARQTFTSIDFDKESKFSAMAMSLQEQGVASHCILHHEWQPLIWHLESLLLLLPQATAMGHGRVESWRWRKEILMLGDLVPLSISQCLIITGSVAEIVGAAAVGFALLAIVVGFLSFYIFYWWRTEANRSSEAGSSDPPNLVECRRERRSFVDYSLANEHHVARRFTLEELEEATKNFSRSNLVGTGSFGLVYKGLLLDGTIVAIKRHVHVPRLAFVEEVKKISKIRHRNLVTLIGYCQEGGLRMLIYEYLPNGSISQHLYYNEHHSLTNLEFKQRLTVAIGAAKGLTHLHSLAPPLVHKNFNTSNILVDENFIAKVADVGILKLLQGSGEVQLQGSKDAFQDPVARKLGRFSESSDVYSFGVFLLELISGIDIARCISPDSYNILAHWVEAHVSSNDLVDCRLGNGFTSQCMKELIALTLQCLNPSAQSRPWMSSIVTVLDRILETEMTLTTIMGDGTAIVTLGSQLFT